MVASSAPENGTSIMLIESCFTAIAIAVAFCWPGIGTHWFAQVERSFARLARRKGLAVTVVGGSALLLRLALLPVCPIPHPFVQDDFSFLLAADTFASGRLANPTPAMWTHFETFHITMKPTYASMYFPGQGLVLAGAKVLTGHPWYGILLMTALMCGAICWMLQAWLPPTWALLGGVLAVLRLGLFSYWINSYSGAGSMTALGGALVLGALPRFMKHVQLRDALLMAAGVILLGTCRPYDAMFLCLPVAFVLIRWTFFGKNKPAISMLFRRTALPLALIAGAGVWMGYYNYRAFGSPTTLPYTIDRATYATAPYFIWQSARPEPVYRHKVMRDFYQIELNTFEKIHSVAGFVPRTLVKVETGILFYSGIVLLIPLIMVRRVFFDRRIRFLILCGLALAAGQLVEIFFIPHYLAPFTAAFYAIGLQAMRHLRHWSPGNQHVGLTLVRLMVAICIVLAGLRVFAEPLHFALPTWPEIWIAEWYGPDSRSGADRTQVEAYLEQRHGRQLALVRYSPSHYPLVEWVYNAADVDDSKVIWARDMGEAENRKLISYYKDRTVWVVEPDKKPAAIFPYTTQNEIANR